MDPITALGVASAVIGFVEIGARIAKRLEELSKVGDVPKEFRDIRTRLPLILTIVSSIQETHEALAPDAQGAFEAVVRSCYEQIKQVETILEKVTVGASESRWRRFSRAALSLVEESRLQKTGAALRDNIELLTKFKVAPSEKVSKFDPRRISTSGFSSISPPPAYTDSIGLFMVPFPRDDQFIGRNSTLKEIYALLEKHERVSVAGVGGVGKSQVAIEFAYRFRDANQEASIFWVFGGSIPRFYEAYKKIAQGLALPGWDDPDVPIMDLVTNWLNQTTSPYLLILDNADDMLYYWPNKYKSSNESDEPATNLASHLPEKGGSGKVLITSRDNRIAARLSKPSKPVALLHMNTEEAIDLFRSDLESHGSEATEDEMEAVVQALDCLPLAITQAASFIDENNISVSEYLEALQGDDAEEFLQEELDDSRRDEDSINSVFRSWKLSFEQISKQKPRAAELLSLLGMLDRQSIPKWLVKMPESVTSAGVLQAFSLIFCPSGSDSFQLHRLCQRFVRLWLKRAGDLQKWQDAALKCVSQAYPTEIGLKEWPICDMLAPHVATVLEYEYQSTEARLELASLLCWAADFDVERGLYGQALARANRSLKLFKELVPPTDERLASSVWCYGRLLYYEARSQSDLLRAQETLREALSISNPSVYIFAECAFELAHLSFALDEEEECLKMGKASYECWKGIEGIGDVRTLDNQHDYALELAMFGHREEAITNWQEILDLCPKSNASEDTKSIYMYRSMASMAEFRGDASTAEILYAKLVKLGSSIYGEQHVHVFDYKLSHAEQLLRLDRLREAFESCQSTLRTCVNKSEWRIPATCYEIMAECCKLEGNGAEEEIWRLNCADTHSKHLEGSEKEGIDALEAATRCLLNNSKPKQAEEMLQKVITWRETEFGPTHASVLEATEFLGICKAQQGLDSEAEAAFDRAVSPSSPPSSSLLYNLCTALWNQQKWPELQRRSREALSKDPDSELTSEFQQMLSVALDKLGRSEDSLLSKITHLSVASKPIEEKARLLPKVPSGQTEIPPRFGRIIHPRTWSA